VYPAVLLTHPDVANSMLQYRVARIPGAQFKAQTYSPPFSGAMFPWESAVTGTELAPYPWGKIEMHISSDIALGVEMLWRNFQDNSGGWLNNTAMPLLQGAADFWMSKLHLDNPGAAPGTPLSLLNVQGPDEYHYPVNNSAYTNAGVIQTLRFAAQIAQLLNMPADTYSAWLDAAARVRMPWDSAHNFHPEYEGYRYGEQVKQADTVMLGFPLNIDFNMTTAARLNDLLAYGGKNTDPNGPAMTWAMFAIGYAELGAGYESQAAAYFNASFQKNVAPPFDVWTEEANGGGCQNFLTGAGGWLQAAYNGYTGLRINDTAATFNPSLPQQTNFVKLRGLAYLGNRIDVSYSVSGVTVALQSPSEGGVAMQRQYLRVYAALPPTCIASSSVCETSLAAALKGHDSAFPLAPSQRGRVALLLPAPSPQNGSVSQQKWHTVPPQKLAVVDANGAIHPLAVGVPLSLPLEGFSIIGQ